MKIGICAAVKEAPLVQKMGFDYCEVNAALIASLPQPEFEALAVAGQGVPLEVSNGLFPGSIKLVGTEADTAQQQEYLQKTFARLQRLGVRVAVFGSGTARRIPKGFSTVKAEQQLMNTARLAGNLARSYGLRIAMEPLNRSETNQLNSVRETLAFVQKLQHPEVGLIADFYHMQKEDEPLSVLREAAPMLWHCHIADTQRAPVDEKDAAELYRIREALDAANYRGRISLEAVMEDFAQQGAQAQQVMQQAFGNA